jgi:hypothetical protein
LEGEIGGLVETVVSEQHDEGGREEDQEEYEVAVPPYEEEDVTHGSSLSVSVSSRMVLPTRLARPSKTPFPVIA